MTPLVIVDVQDGFSIPDREKLVAKVVKHVRMAKQRNAPVILVEFDGFKRTDKAIRDELKGYSKTATVKKYGSNGSDQVEAVLAKKWNLGIPLNVKICGVYTTACVSATVKGLVNKGFRVTVISEACDNSGKEWQVEEWRQSQVKVIYHR